MNLVTEIFQNIKIFHIFYWILYISGVWPISKKHADTEKLLLLVEKASQYEQA